MTSEVDLRELAYDRGGGDVRPRRRVLTRYLIPIGLLLGFLSLLVWASRDLVFPPRAVRVVSVYSTTTEIRREGAPLFKAAGWIEPRPTPVRVAALAPGVVEKLLVVEDEALKQGQPIAQLVEDDARLVASGAVADLELRKAELDDANALLKAAETRLNQPVHLKAPLSEADASLAMLDTKLKNLPFEIRRAAADAEAMKTDYGGKLAAQGVVAGVEVDLAKSKAEAAHALVEELRDRASSLQNERQALAERRDALKTQLQLLADETQARDQALAKVKAAAARVTQASVRVAKAKLQLKRMTVVAPIDGRVFRLIAHPGARIGGGMTQMAGHDGSTVVTMYRPGMLQVRVDVRFEDLPRVELNQSVEIENPALDAPLRGVVLFKSSEADIQKNTLQVKVAIPNPPPVFKPEMLVEVTFLAPKQNVADAKPTSELKMYVPKSLIQRAESGAYVWVADQSDGVARKTAIQTGVEGEQGLIEVLSGLTVSSRIVSSGGEGLRDGDRVIVTAEDAIPDASFDRVDDSKGPANRLPRKAIP